MHFDGSEMTLTVWLLIDCVENVVRDAFNPNATIKFNTLLLLENFTLTRIAWNNFIEFQINDCKFYFLLKILFQ